MRLNILCFALGVWLLQQQAQLPDLRYAWLLTVIVPVLALGFARHQALRAIGCLVISVELVDPRFYHLDTCFCPLPDGTAFWFPFAFDEYGQRAIRAHVNELIDVEEEEAKHFSCNAVVLGRDIVLPAGAPNLVKSLTNRGYQCHELPMSEFIKAGGVCKCLTMFLPQREAIE